MANFCFNKKYRMAEVIDLAAWRVCSRWAMAFCSLVWREKTLVTLTIIRDIIKLPHKQEAIRRMRPKTVKGTSSPKPTVVTDINTHQIELK